MWLSLSWGPETRNQSCSTLVRCEKLKASRDPGFIRYGRKLKWTRAKQLTNGFRCETRRHTLDVQAVEKEGLAAPRLSGNWLPSCCTIPLVRVEPGRKLAGGLFKQAEAEKYRGRATALAHGRLPPWPVREPHISSSENSALTKYIGKIPYCRFPVSAKEFGTGVVRQLCPVPMTGGQAKDNLPF